MVMVKISPFATVFEGAAGICRNIGRVSQLTEEKIEENDTGRFKPLYLCNRNAKMSCTRQKSKLDSALVCIIFVMPKGKKEVSLIS